MILYQHAKNQFIPSPYLSVRVNFRVRSPDWLHPFLPMPTPNIFNYLLICINLYQHAKHQLIPPVHSWDRVLESGNWIDQTHHLTMPNQNVFEQNFSFCDCDQHTKNEVVLSICSREIVELKILQCERLHFVFISGTRIFQNIGFVQEHSK